MMFLLGLAKAKLEQDSGSLHSFMYHFKGSAHCRRPWIFAFFDFSENVDFWNFPVGFGVWEGLQSTGNGCGIQIDGFSAETEPYGSIFDDFDNFGIVFDDLMLVPEGPRTLRECPEGPGTL